MDFMGKPMLAHAIDTARASGLFDAIYVSTEDVEVMEVALKYGATVIHRPVALSHNDIGTQIVIQHAVQSLRLHDETEVCCIYATTPLLAADDLLKAAALLGTGYVIAVGPHGDIGWFYFGKARQFAINSPLWSSDTLAYAIEENRAIDINTMADIEAAKASYKETA